MRTLALISAFVLFGQLAIEPEIYCVVILAVANASKKKHELKSKRFMVTLRTDISLTNTKVGPKQNQDALTHAIQLTKITGDVESICLLLGCIRSQTLLLIWVHVQSAIRWTELTITLDIRKVTVVGRHGRPKPETGARIYG